MAAGGVDPVLEKVRVRSRAYTERFRHDIHAIMNDLRNDQRDHPELYVSQVTVVPEKAPETESHGA